MAKKMIKKYSPINNMILYEIMNASKEDVAELCSKADIAFKQWKRTSIFQRKQVLNQIIEEIKKNKDNIVETIIKDTAKEYCEALTEWAESCDILEYYYKEEFTGIDEPINIQIDHEMWPNKDVQYFYQASGVFAVIKPWNYPFELPIWAIAPILLAGNTIVFKPSELASATGRLLADIIKETDIPEGVFNLVLGDSEVGEYLINDPHIKGVSFTGSTITGQKIYSCGNDKFPKLSLEMGGSDYAIVFEDANLQNACSGILWGAFSNAGQVCVATEKILINKKVYLQFLTRLVEETKKLAIGKDISPVISKSQLRKAIDIIELAVQNGCEVLCGGSKVYESEFEKGNFLYPTVIECKDRDFLSHIPEIFAPIVFVSSFEEDEDALRHINGNSYNLGCSLWTREYVKHSELIENMNVGMIWINEVNLPMPQAPWVGRKKSGVGVNLSKKAVYESMEIKVIHVDNDELRREWWYPYE